MDESSKQAPGVRQSGRTTEQMLTAPQDAVYVWVSSQLLYPRRLAERLGRQDLWVVGPGWLSIFRAGEPNPPHIVVDHAVYEFPEFALSEEARYVLSALQYRRRVLDSKGGTPGGAIENSMPVDPP